MTATDWAYLAFMASMVIVGCHDWLVVALTLSAVGLDAHPMRKR